MGRSSLRIAVQGFLLVAGVLLVPACSDDSGDSGFTDLLIDDFDGGLVNWTVISPTVSIDAAGIGRGPAMLVQQTGAVPAEARTVLTFGTGSGLSVSVDIVAGSSTAEFQIVDNGAPGVRNTFVQITSHSLHCSVQGQTHDVTITPDSHVHKFQFSAHSGFGYWYRDGILLFHSAFGAATVFVDLQDEGTGSKFDLVHVSTP
jgi:hypothetical protein